MTGAADRRSAGDGSQDEGPAGERLTGPLVLHVPGGRWALEDGQEDAVDVLQAAAEAGTPVRFRVVHEDGSPGVLVLQPASTWAAVTGQASPRRDPPTSYPHI